MDSLESIIQHHKRVFNNPSRSDLINEVISNKEALVTATGALATWNSPSSTGRSPNDTYIVKRAESEATVDWTSPNVNAMTPELFDMLYEDALTLFGKKEKLYVIDRVIGARADYALPTRVVTSRALTALFGDTMFRPVSESIRESIFVDRGITVLVLPSDNVDAKKYEGMVRMHNGKASPIVIAMDLDRRVCLFMGTSYAGTLKKTLFTVMNYLLPAEGILPLHSSAIETENGETTVFLGLSGTGKTTLSSDPNYLFIGDDEHGWNSNGIANFEYGCYAKLIRLDREREPAIAHAVFDVRPVQHNGCIIENALMWPDGTFDVDDDRLTENSRTAYPISFLPKVKEGAIGDHPKTIIFLTADAQGILPPVARLTPNQATVWFLMGYTSKLAGTEVGVVEPVSTFSRFFGQPFMPRNPRDYTNLFQEYIAKYQTTVYLVNTGWTGGPYGVGKRMDITLTRTLVAAAIHGTLDAVEYEHDPLFHISVPVSCSGITDASILHPKDTWADKQAFDVRAKKLAEDFAHAFDKNFGHQHFDLNIVNECPGK